MGYISSAVQLKQYAMRKCGYPAIKVEVLEHQLEDCLRDTLQMFGKYHFDGFTDDFALLNVEAGTDTYDLDEKILAVTHILRIQDVSEGGEPSFDIRWDMMQEKRCSFGRLDIVGWEILMQRLEMVNSKIIRERGFIFSPITHKITFFPAPTQNEVWALKVYASLVEDTAIEGEPTAPIDIYNDDWVRKYMVALVKEQWGANLNKYQNVPLPGGGSLNADKIEQQGREDKERYEEELKDRFQEPPDFFVG